MTTVPPTLTTQPAPIKMDREKMRLVVFGEPGMGKTTLALTFPRPLVIDTDGGLVSVTVERPGEYLGEAFSPHGHKDLEALYFWIKGKAADFDTIVIDSLDELVFLLMGELLEAGAAYDTSKGKETHPAMQFVPEQQEYFANQRQLHAFLHSLRQLGKHVVITSGVRDKLGTKRGPDVAPGLGTIVNRWASVMGELVIIGEGELEGKHVLVTAPSEKRQSKTRFKALLPYVVEPTFGSIWSAIEASYNRGDASEGAPA